MPPSTDPTAARSRTAEPLRRKRVVPVPASGSRRRRALNILLVFATVVLLVDALVGDKGFMERMRARREYAATAARLDAIRQENQRLLDQAARLRNDADTIESIAREELGMIRPGELLFIVREARPVSR